MGYIETLFGHQDQILALDCLPSLPTLPPISSTSSIRRQPAVYSSPAPPSKIPTYSRHPLSPPAETLLTVGARDKTARFWKVPEETQLVFRGGGATSSAALGHETRTKRDKLREVLEGKMDALASDDDDSEAAVVKEKEKKDMEEHRYIEGSLECVAMIDETAFLTGGDSGSICLWSTSKKKPVFTCGVAHGLYDPLEKEDESEEDGIKIPPHPRWITALASLRYSDMFASGSYDGTIRLWKVSSSSSKKNIEGQLSTFTLLSTIPCAGVINSLQFITPEESFWAGADWTFSRAKKINPAESHETITSKKRGMDARPILLIAGVGQEHRFGRWVNIKRQMIEVPVTSSNHPKGDAEINEGSFTQDTENKSVPIRNGASVWALFPKGWGEK